MPEGQGEQRVLSALGVEPPLGFQVTREKKSINFKEGSFKKKVLKYGTPKPSPFQDPSGSSV